MDFPLPPSFTKHLPPGRAWSPWSACGRCGQWPMVAMPNDSYIWGAQGARLVSHPTWNTKDMVPWCFIGLALRWRSIDLYIGLYLVEHVEHFWTYRDMLHFEISFWCVPWAFLIRGTAILIASLQKETTISWAYPPFFGGWTNPQEQPVANHDHQWYQYYWLVLQQFYTKIPQAKLQQTSQGINSCG